MDAVPYVAVAFATLIYLIVDIYPSVRSFPAIVRTGSFWLLWFIFVVLNLIAWGALEVAVGAKAKTMVGRPELAALVLIVLATLGTITVLQSFTLKAADVKVVDIGPFVDKYRQAVLVAVAAKMSVLRRHDEQQIALLLANKFAGQTQALRDHYRFVFSFGQITTAQIVTDLATLEADAKKANLSFEQILAELITKADVEFARSQL
ncbi:MAG TPA: hypothetical protein VK530_08960 [Candidatus Acidoferrum sp.]|nr:hypothetical protein [Candidatus Acidoferrum sp.]